MTEEEFERKIRELLTPPQDDPEYEKHLDECGRMVEMLKWDASGKSKNRKGVAWDGDVANEVYTQFEWLHNQP